MGLKKALFPFFLQIKTKSIGNEIVAKANGAKNILDFGCGNMLITKYVQEKLPDSKVEGVDVLDLNLTDMKPVIYDGKRLPYKNGEFDLVYTVFVLHHCEDEVEVLREMLRVAKKKAIIIEEIYENMFEKYLTYVHDWVMNHLESFSIHVPLRFHSDGEWKKIFTDLGWEVVKEKRVYQMPWWITRQKMYIVKRI